MSETPNVLQLVDQVQNDVQRLIKAEIALVKGQTVAAVKQAGIGIGLIVAGLTMVVPIVIALVMVVGFAFSETGLALWLSFLCALGVFLLVLAVLALLGVRQLKKVKTPTKPDISADVAAIKPAQPAVPVEAV
jgi:membrane protein implicated in regulation of membrane protease activity